MVEYVVRREGGLDRDIYCMNAGFRDDIMVPESGTIFRWVVFSELHLQ